MIKITNQKSKQNWTKWEMGAQFQEQIPLSKGIIVFIVLISIWKLLDII